MKFLVGSCGGYLGQSAINILKETYPNSKILGLDCEPITPARFLVDTYFEAPSAKDVEYLEFLRKILSQESIDFFLPMHELEIEICLKNLEIFTDLDVKVITIGVDIWDKCSTKLAAYRTCESISVPFVITQLVTESKKNTTFPAFVKPNAGSGSRQTRIVYSLEELAELRAHKEEFVVQNLLVSKTPELTVAVFRDDSNDIRVIQLERVLQGGASVWVRVASYPLVESFCKKLAAYLSLEGSINVQLMITDTGPWVFEINPRFSSSLELRHKLGFQDLVWSIELASKKKPSNYSPPAIGAQCVISRSARLIT
jgi:carbamoyl-phosphate synthase large subunit